MTWSPSVEEVISTTRLERVTVLESASPRVGIPRSLSYYYIFPFFQGFLEALGATVVVSPATTKRTLDYMRVCPTDEPCISVKLCFAHTKHLLEQQVDFVLLPVLVSLEANNYCCPKLIGVPAMVASGLQIPREQLLSPVIDFRDRTTSWRDQLKEVGARLGKPALAVDNAIEVGKQKMADCEQLTKSGLTTVQAYRRSNSQLVSTTRENQEFAQAGQRTAVLGHSYILYDLIAHNLVRRLQEYGPVITTEMVPRSLAVQYLREIFEGEKMWTWEGHILGAALYLMRSHKVDRVVLVGAFECGPLSVLESFVEKEAERLGVPLLLISLDEHTGEAGLVTRLEAFMDTAERAAAVEFTAPAIGRVLPGLEPRQQVLGTPSVGHLHIALETVFKELDLQFIPTPILSRRSIELGKELAPEFMCFPLVTTLGQVRQTLDAGANTIMMVGGKGRCRLGWYAQVDQNLLERVGYSFDMIIVDSPVPLRVNWKGFREAIRKLTGAPIWRVAQELYFGYRKMAAIDGAEQQVIWARAYESQRGQADKLYRRFVHQVEQADSFYRLKQLRYGFAEELSVLPRLETDPLVVRIVGEFYAMLEPFVNQYLERYLGSQEQIRVLVQREMSATSWWDHNVWNSRRHRQRYQQVRQSASAYLDQEVGGHALESVGLTVLARQEKIDGVIHVMPFTCMPEIVAQNILVRVSAELDVPVMTVIVSEQLGEAGLATRIEAFLDLLEERRYANRLSKQETTG